MKLWTLATNPSRKTGVQRRKADRRLAVLLANRLLPVKHGR
jgi:hypothetical protein